MLHSTNRSPHLEVVVTVGLWLSINNNMVSTIAIEFDQNRTHYDHFENKVAARARIGLMSALTCRTDIRLNGW